MAKPPKYDGAQLRALRATRGVGRLKTRPLSFKKPTPGSKPAAQTLKPASIDSDNKFGGT
jgi:hypothetical protein